LIIPVLFIVFQYLQEKVTGKPVAVTHNHENKNGKLHHNNSAVNHHQPHVHSV
jgi:HAE1 family hydrophobic/amphiphilic exporter-1